MATKIIDFDYHNSSLDNIIIQDLEKFNDKHRMDPAGYFNKRICCSTECYNDISINVYSQIRMDDWSLLLNNKINEIIEKLKN